MKRLMIVLALAVSLQGCAVLHGAGVGLMHYHNSLNQQRNVTCTPFGRGVTCHQW
jgi:hypothetical protein